MAFIPPGDCHLRENRLPEARTALKQLTTVSQSPEARDAKTRLEGGLGESWHRRRGPSDSSAGVSWTLDASRGRGGVAAVFSCWLLACPPAPRLKLGSPMFGLKQYDQARETFQASWPTEVQESAEATVWLARCICGKVLATNSSNWPDRQPRVHWPVTNGRWCISLPACGWRIRGKFDEAIGMFRQVAKLGIQPANGLKGCGGPGGRNIGPPGIRMPGPSVPLWSCTSMALNLRRCIGQRGRGAWEERERRRPVYAGLSAPCL